MKKISIVIGIALAATLFILGTNFANLQSAVLGLFGSDKEALVKIAGYTATDIYSGSKRVALSTNKDSATANGSDSITVSAGVFDIRDDAGDDADNGASPSNPVPDCKPSLGYTPKVKISVSGSGNSYNSGYIYINCSSGYGSTTLTSTVAEGKTVSMLLSGKGGDYNPGLSLGVTFNAPAPTPSTSRSQTSTSTSQATPATQAPTAPAVPVLEFLKVGDSQITSDKISESKFKQGEKIIFSGKTIPNGVVYLYFQSEPFTAMTIANAEGVWTYELTKDLGVGEHTLQIAAADQATNQISEKSQPVKFAIEEAAKEEKPQAKKDSNLIYYLVVGGILIIATAVGFVIYKRGRKNKKKVEEIKNNFTK